MCFGTEALTGGLHRSSTVTALCECNLLHFSTEAITVAGSPGYAATCAQQDTAVPGDPGAEGGDAVASILISLMIRNSLRNVHLFEGLSEKTLVQIADFFTLQEAPRGKEIFRQGDFANTCCVLLDGTVLAVVNGVAVARIRVVPEQPDGLPVLGEAALVNHAPRTATLTTVEPCHLLVLHKKKFRNFHVAVPDFKARLVHVGEMRQEQSSNVVKLSIGKDSFMDTAKDESEMDDFVATGELDGRVASASCKSSNTASVAPSTRTADYK